MGEQLMPHAFFSGIGQFLIALASTRPLMEVPELYCVVEGVCKVAHRSAAIQGLPMLWLSLGFPIKGDLESSQSIDQPPCYLLIDGSQRCICDYITVYLHHIFLLKVGMKCKMSPTDLYFVLSWYQC